MMSSTMCTRVDEVCVTQICDIQQWAAAELYHKGSAQQQQVQPD